MNKEVKRYELRIVDRYAGDGTGDIETDARMKQEAKGRYVLFSDYEALLAERDALRNDHGSMRNALKNARYRIEQGRVWNGMGWTLTGLHAHQQQKALDEIDAALQGEQP